MMREAASTTRTVPDLRLMIDDAPLTADQPDWYQVMIQRHEAGRWITVAVGSLDEVAHGVIAWRDAMAAIASAPRTE